MDKQGALNPDLEEIRNTVIRECSNHSDEWIKNLIKKTSKIHAGFLFEDIKSLQNLCLFVSECQNKVTDPGWQAFGYHLGLNPSLLKVINHNNFNKEDPTYNILLAFVQYEEATIGKIIKALWDIGRLDVICRIKNSLNDLADTVLHLGHNVNFNNSSRENSDYGSQQMSNEKDTLSSGSDSDTTESGHNNNIHDHEIIKPAILPSAPFIFQNIKATPTLISLKDQSLKSQNSLLNRNERNNIDFQRVEKYCLQTSSAAMEKEVAKQLANEKKQIGPAYNISNSANSKKKYGKIIMLTFASDGEKYVPEICRILRRERECYPRIGVLVLSEHIKDVLKDPQFFITGAFHQVDYVCPILTDSYFNLIRRKEKAEHLSDLHLDCRYAQFIYSLMNNYYVSNGCINDKMRCILPDELVPKIELHLLMTIPIFSTWVKLSEVDEMAVQLLKS